VYLAKTSKITTEKVYKADASIYAIEINSKIIATRLDSALLRYYCSASYLIYYSLLIESDYSVVSSSSVTQSL